jgi:hypothetical protein
MEGRWCFEVDGEWRVDMIDTNDLDTRGWICGDAWIQAAMLGHGRRCLDKTDYCLKDER